MILVTADWHLGHHNVLELCNRPFKDVEDMGDAIIGNHQFLMTERDELYHVGDVSMESCEYVLEYLRQIPGRVHIIPGNHDRRWIKQYLKNPNKKIIIHDKIHMIRYSNHRFILCHYPLMRWDQCHRGSIHLYGHEHGSLAGQNGRSLDVGVDCWGFSPVNLETIIDITKGLPILGHHDND